MSRSLKKGPFVDEKLFLKVQRQSAASSRMPIRTWARTCTIVPEFVGHTFQVHNGRTFIDVFCTEDMVGMFEKFIPSFVKQYINLVPQIKEALAAYHREVKDGAFPDESHSFSMQFDAGNLLED